ncbi:MAG: hypothetical protein WD294_01085 [Phycisphaeraceae bacterium]
MNWARHIQDYLLVTLITALVWLYAEGRNVQTWLASSVSVRVVLPSDDLVVVRQQPERFSMQFKGARSELDQVRRGVGSGIALELDHIETGEVSIAMSEHVPNARPISGLNVNVTSVDPPTMLLEIDRLVSRDVVTVFRPRDVQLVEESLSIEPARVTVTLPEGRLADLPQSGDQLQLRVEPVVPIRLLPAGQQQTVRGRVQLPPELADDPHVKIEPEEVQVTFTIDTKDDVVTLPSVPVWIMAPPSDLERYDVVLDEESRVLRDVRVSGPSELIQRVRDGSLRVVATLRLGSDDLVRAVGESATGTVTFEVPPTLTVTTDTSSVRYTVERRDE